jgi:hypothetical protein
MQGPKGQMSGVIPVGKETWGNRPLDSIGSPSGTCGKLLSAGQMGASLGTGDGSVEIGDGFADSRDIRLTW